MKDAALIAMIAGAIRYGHIGTPEEIVAEAKQLVALAEAAAAAPDPTAATDAAAILTLVGAGHQLKTPNAAALPATTEAAPVATAEAAPVATAGDASAERDVLIRLEEQNALLSKRIAELEAQAAPPAAGA